MNAAEIIALGRRPVRVEFEMLNGESASIEMRPPSHSEKMALLESLPDGDGEDLRPAESAAFDVRLVALCLNGETTDEEAAEIYHLSGGSRGPVYAKAADFIRGGPKDADEDGEGDGAANPSTTGRPPPSPAPSPNSASG